MNFSHCPYSYYSRGGINKTKDKNTQKRNKKKRTKRIQEGKKV